MELIASLQAQKDLQYFNRYFNQQGEIQHGLYSLYCMKNRENLVQLFSLVIQLIPLEIMPILCKRTLSTLISDSLIYFQLSPMKLIPFLEGCILIVRRQREPASVIAQSLILYSFLLLTLSVYTIYYYYITRIVEIKAREP